MTKREREQDQIRKWRNRIEQAQERRDQMHQKVWEKNLAAYRGELKPSPLIWADSDPWISIELVHSSIRASVPSLLYNRPKWTVTPKKPIMDEGGNEVSWERADVIGQWLDNVWTETCGNEHVRLAIIAAYLAFGAVKVGYAPTFADDEHRGEYAYDEETGDILVDHIDKEGNHIPKLSKGEFLYDKNGDLIIDADTGLPVLHPGEIQREEFFVEWVPWQNLLFDPEGGNVFRTHRWVVEEWVRPLEDVQEDPRFRPAARKNVTATEKLAGERVGVGKYDLFEPNKSTMGVVDEDCQRVRGWDIYDFEHNRMMVLVDGEENDEFLMDIDMPDGIEHGPFVFLKFNEDPGEFYPRTDCEGMAKVELEYNLTRSQMATHRNQSRTRYAEVRGAGFDGEDGGEAQRVIFQTGPSGSIVQVRSAEGIVPLRKDAMDGTFFTTIPNIRMDFAEVAGQGGEARGVADADTATQASLVAASADVRNNDRRDNQVQTFLARIAKKLIQAGQAHSNCIEWVKITGDPDSPRPFTFQQINPEDLEGEFDCDVAMGSTQPMNTSSQVAMYTQLVTMIAQNPAIAAAPTLMRRMFEAINLRDENLIKELMALGQQAMAAMAPPAGDPTQMTPGTQGLGDIANQFLSAHNTMAGAPTGAPVR